MIVSGIDVGGENVRVVIMDNRNVIAKGETPTGIKKVDATEKLYNELLQQARLAQEDVGRVVATGSASGRISFAHGQIPDAAADARGVMSLVPFARTIINVGAEESRAIKVSPEGKVLDFAINEKCAAGTGTFVETMARALDISLEEMARISLESTKTIPMNAQCAVFAESEVIGLIHAKVEKKDIARAVHDSIAGRIASIARIVGMEKDLVMIGGVAKNQGFIDSLRRESKMDVIVPKDPEYIGALGAAYAAFAGVMEQKVAEKMVEGARIHRGTSC